MATATETSSPPVITAPRPQRAWDAPQEIGIRHNGAWEARVHLHNDTVYVATNGVVMQLLPGGTFDTIAPIHAESFSIAPNGTLWLTGYGLEPLHVAACRSTTQGASWTCNPRALPFDLDLPQIVGLDTNTSIIQSGHGAQSTWFTTRDGGNYSLLTPSPVALGTQTSNLVAANGTVWQLESTRGASNRIVPPTLHLVRLHNGTPTALDSGLPPPLGLPWLAETNDTLWTTAERQGLDGSRSVHAARSLDGGKSWQTFPVSRLAKTAALSSTAANGSRVAVAYYGATEAGAPNEIEATWNYYVAETDNALDARPVWREHLIASDLHHGALCAGPCSTESVLLGDADPRANFAGRIQGIALDAHGNVHAAYARDVELGQVALYYIRQTVS